MGTSIKPQTVNTDTLSAFERFLYIAMPTAFDDSMSLYSCMGKLLAYLKDTVMPALNNNADGLAEVQSLVNQLEDYVTHYFDNLDVQQEINKKLDEMAINGQLTQLISTYIDPIFNSYKSQVDNQIAQQNIRISAVESGSPLAVSSVSDMTDTTRIYVNTSNGYWYYFDGVNWEQGGVYQSSVASTEQYTRDMFYKFIDILKTLADFVNVAPEITWTDGYFYNRNGVQTALEYGHCSELSVNGGEMYYISGYDSSGASCFNILNANDEVIQTNVGTGENSYFVLIPDNGVKLQINKIGTRDFSLEKVTSLQINFSQIDSILSRLSLDTEKVNLIENVTLTNNKIYDGSTGELVDYDGYCSTPKIAIPIGSTVLSLTTSKPTTLGCFFDEDQNFLSVFRGISISGEDSTKNVSIPSNAKYFGINIWKDNPTRQIVTCDALYQITNEGSADKEVDLFMFMGQSNMSGQGDPSLAPDLITGAGYEYSNSLNTIYPILEPVGANDNTSTNGSLITAFANSYYTLMNRPIVACMCAVSGSGIDDWQPNSTYLNRAITYLTNCKQYLEGFGYQIKNINMVWLQGEHEGANGSTSSYYKTMFNNMFSEMQDNGIENCFIIRIGEYNGASPDIDFSTIIQAQTELCQTEDHVIMGTTTLSSMKDRNQMNDQYHMNQIALNEAGTFCGINSALYIKNKKEPTMFDYKYSDLYYSHKN